MFFFKSGCRNQVRVVNWHKCASEKLRTHTVTLGLVIYVLITESFFYKKGEKFHNRFVSSRFRAVLFFLQMSCFLDLTVIDRMLVIQRDRSP